MPDIIDTIQQANGTLQGLLNGLKAAQDAEAKAAQARDLASQAVKECEAYLSRLRVEEQAAIGRYAQTTGHRYEWAKKVEQVQHQLDKINMELAALGKLTQVA